MWLYVVSSFSNNTIITVLLQNKTLKTRAEVVSCSSIRLSWDPDSSFTDDGYYQICCKEDGKNKWVPRDEEYRSNNVTLSNLKSDAQYQFRVRYICGDDEGPVSQPCDPIKTMKNEVSNYIGLLIMLLLVCWRV